MGLLDDLKKQAELVKTQQLSQQTLREETLRLVEERMKLAFQYLNELLKQLAVLKPVSQLVYSVPGVAELKDLQFTESFIDYRKKRVNDREVFDLINFYIKWSLPSTQTIERDMPSLAQKVRDTLNQYGIKFREDEIKNERQVVAKWKYSVDWAIVADVKFRADHDQGTLQCSGKNLIRLGSDDFVIPAGDVNEPWLEEFAKTLLGHPTAFRKYRVAALPR
jgi:hypothetical protein